MPVSEHTYLKLIEEDPDNQWELHCGTLWSKSREPMTWEHGDLYSELAYMLRSQLSRDQFIVHVNHGRTRRSSSRYYIPDLLVIPTQMAARLFSELGRTEIYTEPLPLVVEVWSSSTGRLDVREKLPEYRRRGDTEVWLLHPYDRTLTTWIRQPEGGYHLSLHRTGVVEPAALPGVRVDLDALWRELDRIAPKR